MIRDMSHDNIRRMIDAANKEYRLSAAERRREHPKHIGSGFNDDYTESVEDLIYESVECGDISITEAAELLEMLD